MEVGKPMGLSPGSPNRIRRIEGGVLDFGADMLPRNYYLRNPCIRLNRVAEIIAIHSQSKKAYK